MGDRGRPKVGSLLDQKNIIPGVKRGTDQNDNVLVSPQTKKQRIAVNTRKKFLDSQFWNDLVGSPIDMFPKTKLPQNKVVLQRFLSLREGSPRENLNVLVNTLYWEMAEIWDSARIFTVGEKQSKKIIKNVVEKFLQVKHNNPKKTRENKVSKFQSFLFKLCDLAPADLQDKIQSTSKINKEWEDDWIFYTNMCKSPQVGCMDSKDKKLAEKEHSKQVRRDKEDIRKAKAESYDKTVNKLVSDLGDDYNDGKAQETQEDNDKDQDIVINMKERKKKVILEIDPIKFVEQTTGTTDRLGLSCRQSAMMLATVVAAGGGDVDSVILSKSAVNRKRKKETIKKGKEIAASFKKSEVGYILHYDTKLVNPKGRDTEDRAAVLYSGGEHEQPYLLGIPKFESSSGKHVESGVMDELAKYSIDIKECLGTCYDTTASNSGYKSGAHFRLEKRVGHAILELECRKHVHELHVTHANKAVFGSTKAPQKAHYKKFKESWSTMAHNINNMKVFNWDKYTTNKFLIDEAKEALRWAEQSLHQNIFPRDDYRELNELIVVYLGGTVPGGFRPKRKGAMHEARFMADSIYLLSMELFSGEFEMDERLAVQVHKMSVFISVWHGPNFLRCSLASSAPASDLKYFYDMQQLSESMDPDFSRIGTHVTESIQRHTSYLKAPQVIFGLFDNSSSIMDRKSLASALSAIPRPDTNPSVFKPGKLPEVPLLCNIKECVGSNFCVNEEGNFYPSKTLASLVSAKSYLLFNLLGIEDLSWLDAPVALWSCFPTYTRVKSFVDQLLVVNDGAERGIKYFNPMFFLLYFLGIKLMQELIDRTQDEEVLQHLTQCISQHRKNIGHTKKDYKKLMKI